MITAVFSNKWLEPSDACLKPHKCLKFCVLLPEVNDKFWKEFSVLIVFSLDKWVLCNSVLPQMIHFPHTTVTMRTDPGSLKWHPHPACTCCAFTPKTLTLLPHQVTGYNKHTSHMQLSFHQDIPYWHAAQSTFCITSPQSTARLMTSPESTARLMTSPQSTARLMHSENRTRQSSTGKPPNQASTGSQQATETKTGGSFDHVANKQLRRWTEQLAIHRTHCSDTQHWQFNDYIAKDNMQSN